MLPIDNIYLKLFCLEFTLTLTYYSPSPGPLYSSVQRGGLTHPQPHYLQFRPSVQFFNIRKIKTEYADNRNSSSCPLGLLFQYLQSANLYYIGI